MIEEHIKKDAVVRIYDTKQDLEDYSEEERFQICQGKIKRFISETEIEIFLDNEIEIELQKNVCYIIYFFFGKKAFMCSCYYKSFYEEEEQHMILMELVSPLEQVQRRMYQRVSCHFKILYWEITKEQAVQYRETAKLPEGVQEPGSSAEKTLADISGGGIRFTSKTPVPIDSFLFIRFEIMKGKKSTGMQTVGRVVYSMPHHSEQDCFEIRMKYIGITEEERKQIIHFVFQLERDSINNRWQASPANLLM